MCLILFEWRLHAGADLLLAANRDEFYERPTREAHAWEDDPAIFGGRDLEAGGTWMAFRADGRWAALTNYRAPGTDPPHPPSRGALVHSYLRHGEKPGAFVQSLAPEGSIYAGFNLLVGDREELWYYSNRGGAPQKLSPGRYGLSNHLLDTPWPKVEKGKAMLAQLSEASLPQEEEVFSMLADSSQPPDEALPETGVGLEWERRLGSLFIESERYGTRVSSFLRLLPEGEIRFSELAHPSGELRRIHISHPEAQADFS